MAATDATIVDAGGRDVRVSSPDRVIFPATERSGPITKLDVVRYYLAVGDGIMRALARRPTTLERWPKGVHPGIVVSTLERRLPGRVTTKWWKEERGERIFVDYNQNARDRTIASAYSVRPKPGAPVSAPVTWDELNDVAPEDFTVETMPARFAEVGDRHAAIDDVSHSLEPLLEMYERDEAQGSGDMPYPPDYPKMPGEPKRVQPSRA